MTSTPVTTRPVSPVGRVLLNVSHGGHAAAPAPEDLDAGGTGAADATRRRTRAHAHPAPAGTTSLLDAVPAPVARAVEQDFRDDTAESTTRFDYLFPQLAREFPEKHLPRRNAAAVVAQLTALGRAMTEPDPISPAGESTIPTVYTYWGQFIDHDLTANTDRPDTKVGDVVDPGLVPLPPTSVVRDLRNLRHPALNLDSVYGDGPSFPGQPATVAGPFYSGALFRLGSLAGNPGGAIPGVGIPVVSDRHRDLRRQARGTVFEAQIGDGRNDENLVVAQLHVAMLRFHNEAVHWLQEERHQAIAVHPELRPWTDPELFEQARLLVTRHYQWLVVHDYLATVAAPGVANEIALGGNRVFPTRGPLFMPLEFSVAAFRFGHSMVRGGYDHNRNFGVAPAGGPAAVQPFASLDDLFRFTGSGGFRGAPSLPFNWAIEWDRFVHKGSADRRHFARKIDTQLTPPLHQMLNQGNDAAAAAPVRAILKDLAVRNLLRGYLLSLPTGQAVARALDVPVLTADELQRGGVPAVNAALEAGGFLRRTPLWFYVLKEAEIQSNGNFLGEVGSRIVCETIIGQIRRDPDSYLNAPGGWTPAKGVRLPGNRLIVTIADLLRFARVR
ncbi:peroxidase family protein [Cellulomonas hominis]